MLKSGGNISPSPSQVHPRALVDTSGATNSTSMPKVPMPGLNPSAGILGKNGG